MKKLFAITALLFATLMFSCCEKEPDPSPKPPVFETLSDFNGTWEFVSLEDALGNPLTCTSAPDYLLSLKFTNDATECSVTFECKSDSYTFTNNDGVTHNDIGFYDKKLTSGQNPAETYFYMFKSYDPIQKLLVLERTDEVLLGTRLTLRLN